MSRRNMLPQSIRQSVQRQARQVLTTGQRFDRFDQIRQRHFWSDYLFVPDPVTGMIASGDYKVFTTPSGQSGQGYPISLTDRETNWKSANRVPDNQNFEILELGISLQTQPATVGLDEDNTVPPSAKQSIAFLQNTLLAIQYLTNEISLGYCQDFSQAAGSMMGTASGSVPGAFNRSYTTNGFSAPGLRRRLRIPILLQHGETFTFNFKVLRAFFVPLSGIPGELVAQPFVARMDFWATESFVERS